MELIDKKNAINHIMRELDDSEEYNEGLRTAATIVDQEDCYKIVHCQDCKHWMPYDWMFSEVWKSKNIEDYQEEEKLRRRALGEPQTSLGKTGRTAMSPFWHVRWVPMAKPQLPEPVGSQTAAGEGQP